MDDRFIGSLELAFDARAALAETPVWDDRKQLLYWVDIEGCAVHCLNPADGTDRAVVFNQRVGSIALREKGGLVAALHHGFYLVDMENESLVAIADPDADLPDNRFNDGKCDPAGRFWAGTMDMCKPRRSDGSLYLLHPDLRVERKVTNITVSNGLAWSLDHRTLYYIDTVCQSVDAFDYDQQTGAIANRRVAVQIPAGQGHPDGMTIDSAGMLWVAHWGGWQIARYNPLTGEQLAVIPVPAAKVTSCTFGGPRLDMLYITTASDELSDAELQKQPHAGGIFCVQVAVGGLPTHRFAG